MRTVVTRLITFSPQNVTEEVYWSLGAIYVILLVLTYSSLLSLRVGNWTKLAWAMLSLILPIVGMAAYSLRCLIKADYDFLKQFKIASSKNILACKSTTIKPSSPQSH